MAQEVQVDLRFTSTWVFPDGVVTEEAARDEVLRLVNEYLTSKESVFFDDYGPKAWGGYEGPFIKEGEVSLS